MVKDNYFELTNEFLVLFMTYFMVPLLGAYSSVELSYAVGWIISGVLISFLVANILTIIIQTIIRSCYNYKLYRVKKRYNK